MPRRIALAEQDVARAEPPLHTCRDERLPRPHRDTHGIRDHPPIMLPTHHLAQN